MATVYEFRYVDATGGSTPGASPPGSQQPSAPPKETPKIPEPSPPPQAPGVSGADQIDKIVDRAGKQQPPQTVVPPSQRPVDPAPPQLPTAPSPPTPTQSAQAGVTADQMERLIDRMGQGGDGQGGQQPPGRPGTPSFPALPMPPTPPSAPTPPTPPPQPPTPPQAAPQVNLGGFVGQQLPPGQRPLPQHPALPPLTPPVQPTPPQPPTPPTPPPSPSPIPQPPQAGQAAMRQQIQQLLSGMAGMSGVPGASSLAGMAGAAAGALGAAGFVAAAFGAHQQEVGRMTQYSPELSMAQAQADVMETQRLIEQARRHGDSDADAKRKQDAIKRAGWQFLVNRGRQLNPFHEDFTAPDDIGKGFFDDLQNLVDVIRELTREARSINGPLRQLAEKDQWGDYDWLPTPFDGGQVTQETRDPSVPITGF